MKIRGKLLVSVLAAVIAVLVTASWLGYFTSKKALVKEIQLHAESTLKAYAWELDSEIASFPLMVNGMALAISKLHITDVGMIRELIQAALTINPRVFGSTIAFAPGALPNSPRLVAPYYYKTAEGLKYKDLATGSYDYLKWDWYKVPAETGKAIWSEPYIDVGGGDIAMTTYSFPFYRDGKFLGIVTADIALDALTEDIEKLIVGETGRGFLLSKNGTFLTLGEREIDLEETISDYAKGNPDEETIVELGKNMIAGKTGFVSMANPIEGGPSWVVYGPVPTTSWSLGIVFPEDELLGELVDLKRNMVIISAIGIAAISLLLILISSRITRPISRLAEGAKRIAGGDLSTEPEGIGGKDEVGVLARAFQEMQESLRKTLGDLHEEKEMFTTAFSQMSDGMIILSPQWDTMQYNQAAERYLMLPAKGNLKDHILARFECSIPTERIGEAVEKPVHCELTRRETEGLGPLVLASIIAPIMGEDGALKELVVSVRDITEERAEETSKANFLSLISHKLRTPLTLIKSNAAMMQDGLLGEMTDKQTRQVDSMSKQVAKLYSLIEILIGYSAIEGTQIETSRDDIEVEKFWKHTTREMDRLYRDKHPEISVEIAPGIDTVPFNKQYFGMIYAQLMDNALKFNLSDPAKITVKCRREGTSFITEVSDNGVGIPPEFLDKIFGRFYQIEKYFTGNVEGMGLGLYYVRTIVEHFSGKVDVRSTPGEGTTFTVTIPSE